MAAGKEVKRSLTVKVGDIFQWQKVVCRMQECSERIEKVGFCYRRRNPWIYRGQSFSKWKIQSAFERAIGKDRWGGEFKDSLKSVEDASLEYFKNHARLLGVHEHFDDTEWLSYMQHYGCPTRLVDFTTVPVVALYHAIYGLDANLDFSVHAISRNHVLGAEYLMDEYQDAPEKISDCSDDVGYDVENSRKITNWVLNPRGNQKPDDDTEAGVLCVIPRFQNRRIEAQSGLFLMQRNLCGSFEGDLKSLLEINENKEVTIEEFGKSIQNAAFYDSLRSVKFEFARELRTSAKVLLHAVGMTHRAVFPDFEGLAKNTKEVCFVKGNDTRIEENALRMLKFVIPLRLPTREEKGSR